MVGESAARVFWCFAGRGNVALRLAFNRDTVLLCRLSCDSPLMIQPRRPHVLLTDCFICGLQNGFKVLLSSSLHLRHTHTLSLSLSLSPLCVTVSMCLCLSAPRFAVLYGCMLAKRVQVQLVGTQDHVFFCRTSCLDLLLLRHGGTGLIVSSHALAR